MSSDDLSIHVEGLAKRYEVYAQPVDRLKQMTLPRLQRQFRRPERAYFKEFWALRGVDFDVRRGETVGIVGRNGSGKSTLLQIICGTVTPTSGSVEVRGRIAALLELGSGFNPEFTGRENAYLNATVLGLSREEIDARFDDIAAFADIGEFIEQPVKTYSSGMYIRLAFAVAVSVEPEILVVDEALSVGDELFQRKCFSRIEAIRDKGATILFVSHSAGAVIELCDRAVLMDAGEMLAQGRPKEIINRYHKLLYSPTDQAAAIREEIRRNSHAPESRRAIGGMPSEVVVSERAQETFDADLKPSSTVEFAPRGAHISDVMLMTEAGRQVNGLVRGRRYRFCYKVSFSKALFKVRFGCLIKSVTGLHICGTLSEATIQDGVMVERVGEHAVVEFLFDCMLNPGVYFMNAGVFGVEEEAETLLHRIADAIAFRVLPVEDNKSTEMVDFNVEPRVTFHA
jgi:lipopolysaccharide transport system ATP-binding protein